MVLRSRTQCNSPLSLGHPCTDGYPFANLLSSALVYPKTTRITSERIVGDSKTICARDDHFLVPRDPSKTRVDWSD
jgi:hypothetical protein